jgi:transcriptional regulator with XRE-family HTH domain
MNMKTQKARDVLNKILGHISFGEMIHSLRLSEDISQKELAKKLKISPQELCDIEKGRKFISVERATKFAHLLGDSPEVFALYVIQDELYHAGLTCNIKIVSEENAA